MKRAHLQARNCGPEIVKFMQMRRDLRESFERRQLPSTTTSAPIPHYTTIQNVRPDLTQF